jgi:hypothetical protein
MAIILAAPTGKGQTIKLINSPGHAIKVSSVKIWCRKDGGTIPGHDEIHRRLQSLRPATIGI